MILGIEWTPEKIESLVCAGGIVVAGLILAVGVVFGKVRPPW